MQNFLEGQVWQMMTVASKSAWPIKTPALLMGMSGQTVISGHQSSDNISETQTELETRVRKTKPQTFDYHIECHRHDTARQQIVTLCWTANCHKSCHKQGIVT